MAAVVRVVDVRLLTTQPLIVPGIFTTLFLCIGCTVCRRRDSAAGVLLFTAAWLGSLLLVAGLGYFFQAPLPRAMKESLLYDIALITQEVVYGDCAHGRVGDYFAECVCHTPCVLQYVAWMVFGSLLVCVYCLAARRRARAALEGYEAVSPAKVVGKRNVIALEVVEPEIDDLDSDESPHMRHIEDTNP